MKTREEECVGFSFFTLFFVMEVEDSPKKAGLEGSAGVTRGSLPPQLPSGPASCLCLCSKGGGERKD